MLKTILKGAAATVIGLAAYDLVVKPAIAKSQA
jgi:hypothetical protein